MNFISISELLPNNYTEVTEPNFTGKGNHCVNDLEGIILQYKELVHQLRVRESMITRKFGIEFLPDVVTVRISKLNEVDNPIKSNNIQVGFSNSYKVQTRFQKNPEVGHRFNIIGLNHDGFSTSEVLEIIDDNTFRTHNSIYRWEINVD